MTLSKQLHHFPKPPKEISTQIFEAAEKYLKPKSRDSFKIYCT
jgi:hypothetical protein